MIRCPRCKGDDLEAFRIVIQSARLNTGHDPDWYGEDPTGKQWINCGGCGHVWDTKRYLG